MTHSSLAHPTSPRNYRCRHKATLPGYSSLCFHTGLGLQGMLHNNSKYQLSQMDPRDALLYMHRAAERSGRLV